MDVTYQVECVMVTQSMCKINIWPYSHIYSQVKFAKDIHSSLFSYSISDEEREFYNTDTQTPQAMVQKRHMHSKKKTIWK